MKSKKFEIFGKEYTLDYVDEIKSEDANGITYGLTCHPAGTISIATKPKGYKLSAKGIEITKLHEIMHAIFDAGNYHSCNDDEPLVEWCARCIYHLKKQGII